MTPIHNQPINRSPYSSHILYVLVMHTSQEIALHNMAMATAIMSLVFGIAIPSTTAIIGGMTSTGGLVPNPYWERNDFEVLQRAGVERVVVPACAHSKLHKLVGGAGSGHVVELVPVNNVEDIIEKILKPLAPAPQGPPIPTSSSQQQGHHDDDEGEEEEEENDSGDDFDLSHFSAVLL